MNIIPADYAELLQNLKDRIRAAQIKAALTSNQTMLLLYWDIGQDILNKQTVAGWGAKVIQQLSKDLQSEFPDQSGYSERNLKYMRAFAEAYPDRAFVQAALAQITWYHNITLLQKVKDSDLRLWYVGKTVEQGWSRDVMVMQIESQAHQRLGQAQTNFAETLPSPQSDLAHQMLKDPYKFDFLTLSEKAQEKELEKGLLLHIRDFLIELGAGFAFVGSQVVLEVSERDFKLDLLFYHLKLRCYVVVELKVTEFQPEYAGKMNFYLSAVDDQLRHPDDAPTIGLILCKGKDKTIVEYALRGSNRPIGVSEFQLTQALPEDLQSSLPTVESLEHELEKLDTEPVV
ncbi:DUF1016 domain-containing protein [bacterium (Candidatus Blackallbacteria) CG17_big_fil_post_rev_8_21_14_2_50_48_46]|uniref:DUF1016 domain-containing protein n=1 Tax=bacterium (Candidatus Blackallbacteria) CG17_big_fil_post_rev_8_21_14_2_50_48_46 TaxID=2014261 RepID=A0A2M7G5Q5_9BACT|nr:MAG: hypothetical protein COW64_06235 [bacterium (Candidatus Blackallbacteria) CG18_big_fil_WC_8_21_14_2_50_49_26]PIW17274.1 MAG: DUF1016 domain-containing protein [bacterium (Candidatus Blackallbacteria) CG17_big_fil_post_rev_8_21_14_2_50_48_46]